MKIKVVSLKDQFLAWGAAAANAEPGRWAGLFEEKLVAPNRTLYDALVFDDAAGKEKLSPLTEKSLRSYHKNLEEFSEAHDFLGKALGEFSERFLETFPDGAGGVTLAVMPSLGRFDGREADIAGEPVAGFGVDYFRRSRAYACGSREKELNLTAAHELFHLYHASRTGLRQKPQDTVLTWLWIEGLATYASLLLTPGATETDALADGEMAQACPVRYKEFARLVKPILNSADPEAQGALFCGGRRFKDLPSRTGYCLGLKAVMQLCENGRTLKELSAWPEERARAELAAVISAW